MTTDSPEISIVHDETSNRNAIYVDGILHDVVKDDQGVVEWLIDFFEIKAEFKSFNYNWTQTTDDDYPELLEDAVLEDY